MLTLVLLFVATTTVHSQMAPECANPPSIPPDACCQAMPTFITNEVLDGCGIKDDGDDIDEQCETFECVLRGENMLTTDDKIDRANIKTSIAKYYNQDWNDAIENTLRACYAELDDSPNNCEARAFASCFMHHMILNCPSSVWINTDQCNQAKVFLDKCLPAVF